MAIVLTDAKVSINGATTDLTSFVKTVSIELARSEHDNTVMGSGGKTRQTGMTDGSVSLELNDDFTAVTGLDAILWTVFSAGTNVELRVRTSSAAISTSNPEYRFMVCPVSFPVGGAVDELAGKSISWPISGAVTRQTT